MRCGITKSPRQTPLRLIDVLGILMTCRCKVTTDIQALSRTKTTQQKGRSHQTSTLGLYTCSRSIVAIFQPLQNCHKPPSLDTAPQRNNLEAQFIYLNLGFFARGEAIERRVLVRHGSRLVPPPRDEASSKASPVSWRIVVVTAARFDAV